MSENAEILEAYNEHYRRFLGTPSAGREYPIDDKIGSLEVLFFDKVSKGQCVMTTLGMSKCRANIGTLCEVMCIIDRDHEAVAQGLVQALFHVYTHWKSFGPGTAVHGLGEGFRRRGSKDTEMDGFYFSRLLYGGPEFASVATDVGQGVILSAFTISKSEFDYFKKNGAARLEKEFADDNVDVGSFMRWPVV
jgi:hypothetical protein